MVVEMVAGLGIGFGIGYALDSVLGTLPIFMVLFTLFGLAAGINVMMRTAKEIEEKQATEVAERDERN
jgi:ATP synthase protein I